MNYGRASFWCMHGAEACETFAILLVSSSHAWQSAAFLSTCDLEPFCMINTKAALFILSHSHTILSVEPSQGDEDEVFQRPLDIYKAEQGIALNSEFNRKLISDGGEATAIPSSSCL